MILATINWGDNTFQIVMGGIMAYVQSASSGIPSFFSRLICKHNWVKREAFYQPERSTRRIAYKCSHCEKAKEQLSTKPV